MSKITLNFKNLCAIFSKKLNDEFMVGLLDLSDFYGVPEMDIHHPKVTIETEKKVTNPNGETVSVPQVWTYADFCPSRVCCAHNHADDAHAQPHATDALGTLDGKIVLEVHGVAAGINQELTAEKIADLEKLETEWRRKTGLIKPAEHVTINTFDSILDFQRRLHRNEELQALGEDETLTVNPLLCKARFHFNNGLLYAITLPNNVAPVEFEPENLGADGKYADETGLEIVLPEDGYAVLRFTNNDTQDFIFQGAGDQHYFVTIDNAPPKHDSTKPHVAPNHFKYFYKLVTSPHTTYLPSDASPEAGTPTCRNNGFGDAGY